MFRIDFAADARTDACTPIQAALQQILPPVPLIEENGFLTVSPYSSYPINNGLHNGETPELYSVHPYRYYSLGRFAPSVPGIATFCRTLIFSSVKGVLVHASHVKTRENKVA